MSGKKRRETQRKHTDERSPLGEFEAANRETSRRNDRRIFLLHVGMLAPAVRQTLATAIATLPRQIFDLGGYEDLIETFHQFERIRNVLAPWQQQWRLHDDWVAEMVMSALQYTARHAADDLDANDLVDEAWRSFDEKSRPFSPVYPPTGGLPGTTAFRHFLTNPKPPVFRFGPVAWYGEPESRADIDRHVTEQFRREWTAYLDEVEQQQLDHGRVRTRRKRATEGGDQYQQFDWLIRRQILGESQKSIAKETGRDIGTIDAGIQAARKLLGLSARRPK